jgi:putative DNA primase/helicase
MAPLSAMAGQTSPRRRKRHGANCQRSGAGNRGIYQRAGKIVRVEEIKMKANEGGEILRQHIRELGEHSLIEGLSASARFERFDGRTKSMVEVFAPMWLARTLQQRGSNLRLPILSGVIYAPTLRKDGTLLCEPGYDEKTGLVFDPQGIEFQPISNNPSKEQGLAELDRLKALLSTFCFETPADRSVALSAILTAVVRKSAIKQAPMHCFDWGAARLSETSGCGKLNRNRR